MYLDVMSFVKDDSMEVDLMDDALFLVHTILTFLLSKHQRLPHQQVDE